jgi:hypothetical protein
MISFHLPPMKLEAPTTARPRAEMARTRLEEYEYETALSPRTLYNGPDRRESDRGLRRSTG